MIDNLVILIVIITPIITMVSILNLIDNYFIEKKEKKQNALDTQKRIQKIKMNELFKTIEKEYK